MFVVYSTRGDWLESWNTGVDPRPRRKQKTCFFTQQNDTTVDPKQFTVSKFRLKPVILISECFCSRCGHTNQHPPPTCRETTGRQRETRPLQSPRRRPHQRTPTPHMKGDNRRQRETTPLQSPRSRPHQPTPRRPHLKLH